MTPKHQIELWLPRIDDATPQALRDALVEHGKNIILAGYDPADLMQALLWSGTTLAYDLGGADFATDQLEELVDAIARVRPRGGFFNFPAVGHA